MTKNKARKSAARERASRTGERYVVARRSLDDSPSTVESSRSLAGVLDTWTHRIAWVPEHRANAVHPHSARSAQLLQARRAARAGTAVSREPRILKTWQNWIARQVRRS